NTMYSLRVCTHLANKANSDSAVCTNKLRNEFANLKNKDEEDDDNDDEDEDDGLFSAVNTHCHADHITGTGLLKKKVFGLKSAISKHSGATADMQLSDGDRITFGKHIYFSSSSRYSLLSNGQTVSTVDEEKKFNPRLTKTLPEFVNIMNNLNLPKPKKIGTVCVY
uniref:ETHE1 persulfide dioxygenase n=1 Tax=Sinocyclocheilus grahami TaxID=75366 RepID=A0A672PCZ4_SINGR